MNRDHTSCQVFILHALEPRFQHHVRQLFLFRELTDALHEVLVALQLAAAILSEMDMSNDDISVAVDAFRRSHMGELQMLATNSGSSLGYGLPTDLQSIDLEEGDELIEITTTASTA